MTTQISKGLIGKEDFNFNTSELYPTETFSRVGNVSTTTMIKTPTIYKSHYSIVNACHFNSAAKNDTTLTQALSYIGSSYRTLYIEPGSWSISNNLTIPANIRFLVDIGATITVASGKTLTINGYVDAGAYPIFAGSGTVTITTYPQDQAWTTGSTQKLTAIFSGSTGGSHINEFSTDGTLGGNSDLACPTEKATKTYIDTATAHISGTGSLIVNADLTIEATSFINQDLTSDASPTFAGMNLNLPSSANGDIYYRASGILARLAKGTANHKLFMDAAGTAPEWAVGIYQSSFSIDTATATGTQAVTGVGFKPTSLIFIASVGGVGQNSIGFTTLGTEGCLYNNNILVTGQWLRSQTNVYLIQDTGIIYSGALLSRDADGFTQSWTKTGAKTGTATIDFLAFR